MVQLAVAEVALPLPARLAPRWGRHRRQKTQALLDQAAGVVQLAAVAEMALPLQAQEVLSGPSWLSLQGLQIPLRPHACHDRCPMMMSRLVRQKHCLPLLVPQVCT